MSRPSNNKEKLFVIKIGGNVIDNKDLLRSFLKEFSEIKGKKILVHGGGKIATTIGERLGIHSKYIDGRRITDNETIDLVTMVYGGLINKRIAALLQSLNCNAIGISGADANLIPATKRVVKDIDYGWVGDINVAEIDGGRWKLFLENEMVPVVAPLTHDNGGFMLNTNADTIASVLSVSLSKYYDVCLIFCFEKNGVLSNVENENSVISQLKYEEYQTLKKNNKLFAGILPKIDNAFDAINKGVKEIVIGNSSQLSSLINGTGGTKIYL